MLSLTDSLTYALINRLTNICSHLLTHSHMLSITDSLTYVLIH